jgi:hypothetical protein
MGGYIYIYICITLIIWIYIQIIKLMIYKQIVTYRPNNA